MKQAIGIYRDEGVDLKLLLRLCRALKIPPILMNHKEIIRGEWRDQVYKLIVPGGRDTPYHNALKGEGNRHIRSFVEEGGSYLGICAGAYYGAHTIEFERGYPLEVLATRELAFYPGIARGSAYGPNQFSYKDDSGSRIALLSWNTGETSSAYFNGGCTFIAPESYPHVSVLARYADLPEQPAAIVHCKVGFGTALLSGIHPEYHPPLLDHLLNERFSV